MLERETKINTPNNNISGLKSIKKFQKINSNNEKGEDSKRTNLAIIKQDYKKRKSNVSLQSSELILIKKNQIEINKTNNKKELDLTNKSDKNMFKKTVRFRDEIKIDENKPIYNNHLSLVDFIDVESFKEYNKNSDSPKKCFLYLIAKKICDGCEYFFAKYND